MKTDHWGYEITTHSESAAEAISKSFAGLYQFRTDSMPNINTAIEADPDCGLAYIIKGLLLDGLKKPEMSAMGNEILQQVSNTKPPKTPREKLYLKALEATVTGQITQAVTCYQHIANQYPKDLFAMRMAQSELFWIGEVGWMRDISEGAAAAWSKDTKDYASFLSVRAFGLEENGDSEAAEKIGREALEIDPSNIWAAHAVAHTQIMRGQHQQGIQLLENLSNNWGTANHIKHHMWWHIALFYIEHGDMTEALNIYDQKLRDLDSPLMQAIPDFYVDIQNDTSMLQRLEFRGVDVDNRWQPIADLAATRVGNHLSPFTSAHCALALAAAERWDTLDELIGNIESFIQDDPNPMAGRYALAVLPTCRAARAYHRKQYAKTVALLMPVRRNLWQMGGSHAQRDVFYQLLINAAMREKQLDTVQLVLNEIRAIGLNHLEERSSYADCHN